MKHILKGFALCAGMAAGAAWAQAQPAEPGLHYNELSVGYGTATADLSGTSFKLKGVGVSAQMLVHPQVFVGVSNLSTTGKLLGIKTEVNQSSALVGWRYGLAEKTDLNVVGGLFQQTARFKSVHLNDDGNFVGLGVRSMIAPQVEVSLAFDSIKLDGDSKRTNQSTLDLGYHWNPEWVTRLGYTASDGVKSITVSVGYKF